VVVAPGGTPPLLVVVGVVVVEEEVGRGGTPELVVVREGAPELVVVREGAPELVVVVVQRLYITCNRGAEVLTPENAWIVRVPVVPSIIRPRPFPALHAGCETIDWTIADKSGELIQSPGVEKGGTLAHVTVSEVRGRAAKAVFPEQNGRELLEASP
jgi:hypothetical protein